MNASNGPHRLGRLRSSYARNLTVPMVFTLMLAYPMNQWVGLEVLAERILSGLRPEYECD